MGPRAEVPASTAPFGRTVLVMTVAGLLVVGQMYVVLPLLPMMARAWEVPNAAATWTTTAFGMAYAGGFLVSGPLSDLFGRRRVVTMGLTVLALATVGVAAAPSLPVAVCCRVVQGVGAAGYSPAALAYLGERIAPNRRSVAVTSLVTAMVAATVTGQLAGQAGAAVAGWRGSLVLNAACVAVLTVALRLVMLDTPVTARRGGVRGYLGTMARLITDPVLLLINLGALPVLGGFVALFTAIQLLGPVEVAGRPEVMVAVRAASLPGLVAVPFLAPVLNRVRPIPRAACALFAAAAAVAGLGAVGSSSVAVFGILMVVFVAATAVVSPGLTELTGARAEPARGAGTALYTFSLLAGASLGPVLVSGLGGAGFDAVLLAICAAQLAGGIVLLIAGSWLNSPLAR